MGGCAGKNKSKQSKTDEIKSNLTEKPKLRKEDHRKQSKLTSSEVFYFENVPVLNSSTEKIDQDTLNKEENGIDSDTQRIIEQSDGINKLIGQIFSNRVVSVSNSELEYELANLIYGHPENDYAEQPLIVTTFKSTEV